MDVQKPAVIAIITLLLTLAAAMPRFYDLGAKGFYGDEETTSFPSRSVAQGNGPLMPSGMTYLRALPHTWLNAISARLFGLEDERAYRLAAAILGTLTIPLLFLCARPLLGTSVALLASLLLAFSEWHIFTSREARMYAPFLFFYIASGFAVWRWIDTNTWRDLTIAIVLLFITFMHHQLGIFAIGFILFPLLFMGWSRIAALKLISVALLAAIAAHLYGSQVIEKAFKQWKAAHNEIPTTTTPDASNVVEPTHQTALMLPGPLTDLPSSMVVVLAVIGLFLGIWLARSCHLQDKSTGAALRQGVRYGCAILSAIFICIGFMHAGIIVLLTLLLMYPPGLASLITRAYKPLIIMAAAVLAWTILVVAQHGLYSGLKSLVEFPFPYLLLMAQAFPGVFLLFVGMCIVLALRANKLDDNTLRATVLAVILPASAVGAISEWGGMRYLIMVYPYMLLIAAAGLLQVCTKANFAGLHPRNLTIIASIIILSGILGGHGLPQAVQATTLSYEKPANDQVFGFPFYPDHQAPGRYVKQHMLTGDIIIAEDALQQHWYIGKVDYWLRDPASHTNFLYHGTDGLMRDNYVGSAIITAEILKILKQNKNNRLWLITSGETNHKPDYYLSAAQHQWLTEVENTQSPRFTGRDGITKVYCLNCGADPAALNNDSVSNDSVTNDSATNDSVTSDSVTREHP